MNGWIDGLMGRWEGGWVMGGWVDGWIGGWVMNEEVEGSE